MLARERCASSGRARRCRRSRQRMRPTSLTCWRSSAKPPSWSDEAAESDSRPAHAARPAVPPRPAVDEVEGRVGHAAQLRCSRRARHQSRAGSVGPPPGPAPGVALTQVGELAEQIRGVAAKRFAPLTTLCGVNLLTAGTLAGILGPGHRFANDAELAARG